MIHYSQEGRKLSHQQRPFGTVNTQRTFGMVGEGGFFTTTVNVFKENTSMSLLSMCTSHGNYDRSKTALMSKR